MPTYLRWSPSERPVLLVDFSPDVAAGSSIKNNHGSGRTSVEHSFEARGGDDSSRPSSEKGGIDSGGLGWKEVKKKGRSSSKFQAAKTAAGWKASLAVNNRGVKFAPHFSKASQASGGFLLSGEIAVEGASSDRLIQREGSVTEVQNSGNSERESSGQEISGEEKAASTEADDGVLELQKKTSFDGIRKFCGFNGICGSDKSQTPKDSESSLKKSGTEAQNEALRFRWGDLDEDDLKTHLEEQTRGKSSSHKTAEVADSEKNLVTITQNDDGSGNGIPAHPTGVSSSETCHPSPPQAYPSHGIRLPNDESNDILDRQNTCEGPKITEQATNSRSHSWRQTSSVFSGVPALVADDVSDSVPLHSSAVGVVYLEGKVGDSKNCTESDDAEGVPEENDSPLGVFARLDSKKLMSVDESENNQKPGISVSGLDLISPDIALVKNLVVSSSSVASNEVGDDGRKEASRAASLSMFNDQEETLETKERYRQRLWCFLFDNLYRAVDELYLMCELECDIEQMEEALLVLSEAGIDFKELKTRAEAFEKVRKESGTPGSISSPKFFKGEHQRPHAIAWEVRRMASSPHRSDTLLSSLEAFNKVQADKEGQDIDYRNFTDTVGLKSSVKESSLNKGRPTGFVLANRDAARRQLAAMVFAQPHESFPDIGQTGTSVIESKVQESKPEASSASVNHFGSVEAAVSAPATMTKCLSSPGNYSEDVKAETNSNEAKDWALSGNNAAIEAWKEKKNWGDILTSPLKNSISPSRSPSTGRKSIERVRVLHDKLMSPEKKKKSPMEMKKQVDEKQARATKIRMELENERVLRLQRTTEKLNRVSEWKAVQSSRLREGMHARQQRGESRHEAHLAQIARRASDQSSKVSEVRFITSLNEENKKLSLQQKLQDSEARRAERLQNMRIKQKEDLAREEAALERRKQLEADRLQRIAEAQRKKNEANARREEERKAASAAREARAVEQVRKKEVRAKAQEEETLLLGQKLAEKLRESSIRRKFYLEQIKERAGTEPDKGDHKRRDPLFDSPRKSKDQGSSLSRQPAYGDRISKTLSSGVENEATMSSEPNNAKQQAIKKRVKKLRQRLAAHKMEFVEPVTGPEGGGVGSNSVSTVVRSKIGRWLQDLQRLLQSRKAGNAGIISVAVEIVGYLQDKEAELHAARQAGLLDFIATALPATHTSKPGISDKTISLLYLLVVLLALPANRTYFIARNLLPPLVPMLSTALEIFCSFGYSTAAGPSSNPSAGTKDTPAERPSTEEQLVAVGAVLEGLLLSVTTVMGHRCTDERLVLMQDDLAELIASCEVVHRLCNLFALFDRPLVEGAPIPAAVRLGLRLLETLTVLRGRTWKATSEAPMSLSSRFSDKLVISNPDPVVAQQGTEPRDSTCISGSQASLEKSNSSQQDDPKSEDVVADARTSKLQCDIDQPGEVGKEGSDQTADDHSAVEGGSDSGGTARSRYIDLPLGDDSNILKETKSSPSTSSAVWPCLLSVNANTPSVSKVDNPQGYHSMGAPNRSISLLLAIAMETGLIGLPSLLTAVLLQANPRYSPEQAASALPSNFDEVATSVLRILNNLARLNLFLVQNTLAMPDLRIEFFHVISFLLSHCTCKWKSKSDQVASLLLETLLLLGYFALLHPENQAVLRWGKTPTILHKICELPFAFFSDSQLTPILNGTLVAVCYGCHRNRDVVQQELSTKTLVAFLRSMKEEQETCVRDQQQGGNPQVSDVGSVIHEKPQSSSEALEDFETTAQRAVNDDLGGTQLDADPGSSRRVSNPRSSTVKQVSEITTTARKSARNAPKSVHQVTDSDSTTSGGTRGSGLGRIHGKGSTSSPSSDSPSSLFKTTTKAGAWSAEGLPKFSQLCPDPLHTSDWKAGSKIFLLRNRFPRCLWNDAEEFFAVEPS